MSAYNAGMRLIQLTDPKFDATRYWSNEYFPYQKKALDRKFEQMIAEYLKGHPEFANKSDWFDWELRRFFP